jgi:hypothetical protein
VTNMTKQQETPNYYDIRRGTHVIRRTQRWQSDIDGCVDNIMKNHFKKLQATTKILNVNEALITLQLPFNEVIEYKVVIVK